MKTRLNVKAFKKTYRLSPEACDAISEQVMACCDGFGVDKKEALRYRLSAEECLLYWLDRGCAGKPVTLNIGRRMRALFISIEAEGEPLNPYSEEDNEFGSYSRSILVNLTLEPEYAYEKGVNRILFRVRKKPLGQIATLGIVMLAALAVGLAGKLVIPVGLRTGLLEAVITPVYGTFFNILGCVAGPMIFLSVAWGVYGIGDAATLGRIGKRMMLRYMGMTLLVCACFSALFPLIGPGLSESTGSEGHFESISQLILGIFPSTVIEPFQTGNTLQIIFMAIIIGIALLYLGKKTSSVARAIEEINLIVQFLMEIVSKLVPYVIFLVVVNMIWSDSVDVLMSSWQIVAVMAVAFLAVAAAFLVATSLRRRVRPPVLLNKIFPTFLVALTTASSAAAFSTNVTICKDRLGIDSSLIRFGIPLGMVMCKPISAVYNLLLVFFFANKYAVSCSVGWIIVAVVICSVISIATPPIPGGGAIAYSIIFAQMGIPAEAMSIALTIDIITDFIITAFEMVVLPLSLVNISYGLGMIDGDVLASP